MTSGTYTVGKLAKMAGVSIRTLHHYDRIGLLHPASRSETGYRRYGEQELLRLQQILFFKELDLSLEEIRDILDDPGFDLVTALRRHHALLQQRAARLSRLLETVDKTIRRLTEDTMTMTDEELYEGFTPEQRERYPREARERYGDKAVDASEQKLRKLSKAEWTAIKAESDAISSELADLMGHTTPDAPEVQALMARHRAWLEHFHPVTADYYVGLASLYTENPEFRAHYDEYAEGLADFLAAAMKVYAQELPES